MTIGTLTYFTIKQKVEIRIEEEDNGMHFLVARNHNNDVIFKADVCLVWDLMTDYLSDLAHREDLKPSIKRRALSAEQVEDFYAKYALGE